MRCTDLEEAIQPSEDQMLDSRQSSPDWDEQPANQELLQFQLMPAVRAETARWQYSVHVSASAANVDLASYVITRNKMS